MKTFLPRSETETLRHLARMANRVVTMFTSGRNPTMEQIENLKAAAAMAMAEKICGHGVFEECDCSE